jgi:Predicted RNA-binding protein (contains KH domains)
VKTALLLARDDYYFYTIDLDNVFKNKNRIKAVKGRLIGIEGKAIRYIGTVSSAKMCVYGDKISVIGKMEAVEEAEEAIKSIINGSKHGKAYSRMESVHRRHIDEKKAL